MAKDRELTLKLNLKPGDVRALKQTFKSIGDDAAKAQLKGSQAVGGGRSAAPTVVGSKGKILDVLPGDKTGGKIPSVLPAGKASAGGGAGGKAGGLLDGLGLGKFGKALDGIGKALGPATAALGVALGISKAIVGIFKTITSFVSKANPGAVQRLGLAMDDLVAVLGHTLTPVVEVVTKAIRNFGDFLATILPSSDEFRQALAPVFEELDEFRDVLATIAPYIKEYLTMALKNLGVVLKLVYGTITNIIRGLKALGLVSNTAKLTSSVGAAARPHTFTNPEEFAKSIYLAAANQQGKEPQKETAENTRGILDVLKGLPGMLNDLGMAIGAKLLQGWEFIRDNWREILVGALTGGLGSIFGDLKGLDFSGLKDLPGQFAENLKSIPDAFTNAVNELPNALRNALTELPRLIAQAVQSVLPSLPSLPSIPGGGGGGSGGGAAETAAHASRSWLTFGLL